MASIRKRRVRGEDRFDVRWRDPDGTERTHTCPTLRSAQTVAREIAETVALGRRWEPGHAAAAPLIEDLAEKYLAYRATRRRASTLKLDEWAIERFRVWLWGHHRTRTVDGCSADRLQEWDVAIRGELATASANTYVVLVRGFFAWLSLHPEARAFVPAPPSTANLDLPEVHFTPPRSPRWHEMDAAIAAAEGWLADAFAVMRYTGLRQRQAMAIGWDDLHEDGREGWMLQVRPELGKSRQERAGRLIPVTPHLVEWFAGRGVREGLLVAPDADVRRVVPHERAVAAWERSGVTEAVWRGHPNHAFRYGFESGLIAAGADYLAVEHLIGHAVKGAGASYLDTGWALKLREAVALVPRIGEAVDIKARQRG